MATSQIFTLFMKNHIFEYHCTSRSRKKKQFKSGEDELKFGTEVLNISMSCDTSFLYLFVDLKCH